MAIGAIADLAVARFVAGVVVPVLAAVHGAAASGPGLDHSRAVPTAQSLHSAVSFPPAHPWRLWRSPHGSLPEFHGRSWASPRRLSAPRASRKTAATP